MVRANPYTPGAGFMPSYLAGREPQLELATLYLAGIKDRYPQQSIVYYGLRGVGKTVLLTSIESIADTYNILYDHIEADTGGKFTNNLLTFIQKCAYEVSLKTKMADFGRKILSYLKAFYLKYNIEGGEFSIGVDTEPSFVSGVFSNDLTSMMVQLGKAAVSSGDTICLFIDEMQYLSREELAGLIVALHRCNQLRLPIMAFCAGLPKILREVGEACSYSERLFRYELIGPLKQEEAAAAIEVPAQDFGVSYAADAVEHIITTTGGYPYFIQQMCSTVWSLCENQLITLDDVKAAEIDFWATLDRGFFAVRYNRCTTRERAFLTAMAKCGTLPCNITTVASIMKTKTGSISPIRAQLISKGMIYPTSRGEIDYTVPQFDKYLRRINPKLEL